ncbi:hypothetical protein key_090 [Erwinia phage KEY]|uniref:Uncharacterized protein n=1 Tax=Erwinia phage KEY TaxID=2821255 RepID=A0AAE8BE59_9CAUD|nr:hypothetical protein key_090 [Erwinia phage KEY]
MILKDGRWVRFPLLAALKKNRKVTTNTRRQYAPTLIGVIMGFKDIEDFITRHHEFTYDELVLAVVKHYGLKTTDAIDIVNFTLYGDEES